MQPNGDYGEPMIPTHASRPVETLVVTPQRAAYDIKTMSEHISESVLSVSNSRPAVFFTVGERAARERLLRFATGTLVTV